MTSLVTRRSYRALIALVSFGLFVTTMVTADAAPTPPAAPPSWTVLLAESWPGADGAAWPSAWQTSVAAGAVADVRSGQGRLLVDRSSSWVRTTAGAAPAAKDLDLVTSYQWNQTTASAYLNVYLRGSGGWQNAYRPMSGYGVELTPNSTAVHVTKNVNGVRTVMAAVPNGSAKTTAKQWLRIRVAGQQLMFRTWLDSNAEPTTWAYVATDASVATPGRAFTSLVRGSDGVGARSVSLDNLILSTPAAAVPTTTTTTVPPTTTTTKVPPTTTTTVPQTTTTTAPAPAPGPPGAPAGWRLYWADGFDGPGLNSAWRAYHSTYGEGNNELQCLTPSNVRVTGGSLKIDARREQVTCPGGDVKSFTSGFLGTRETGTYFPRYGRFEMRAKLPHAQGIWPGFWLRHRNGAGTAEVDVMEYFHSQVPGKTTSTLHLDGRPNISKRAVLVETPTATPGWHTWAVEIEPVPTGVRFVFLLDNTPFHSYIDTQRNWASAADPQGTWDMAVNASVGGNWAGRPDDALGYLRDLNRCAQSGTAPAGCSSTGILRAQFPVTYELDYVRVYTR